MTRTRERAARPGSTQWAWTLASGLLTLLLAVIAFLLPEFDWMPPGGLVGWLLFLAGAAEFAFGTKRGTDGLGRTAKISGLLTALAGLVFIARPLSGYLPVAHLVLAWLLLRGGCVLAMALGVGSAQMRAWLVLSGAADMLLAAMLVAGLQLAALVISLFGPTREVIAQFSLILCFSFLVTGISQIGIALVQRRQSGRGTEAAGA